MSSLFGRSKSSPSILALSRRSQGSSKPLPASLSAKWIKSILRLFSRTLIISPGLTWIRWDIDNLIVDCKMPVQHQLPGRFPRWCKSEAIRDIIQTALQQHQEVFAGDAFLARGFFEIAVELPFQNTVNTADFLLFAKLETVLGTFTTARSGHADRERIHVSR